MADHMITCPECYGDSVIYDHPECEMCWNKGGIPDRRSPTANDRAVERVLAWCRDMLDDHAPRSLQLAEDYVCERIINIIREEAERG